jgi:hypothetical protein
MCTRIFLLFLSCVEALRGAGYSIKAYYQTCEYCFTFIFELASYGTWSMRGGGGGIVGGGGGGVV